METKTTLKGEKVTHVTENRGADRLLTDVLLIEADAIRSVIDTTRESLAEEVDLISDSNRPLIVAGVGINGLIEKTIVSASRF